MAVIRLFAAAAEAAGTRQATVDADSVAEALDWARTAYGERFADVLTRCRIAVNGEPVEGDVPLAPDDEVAILPPVAGG